MTIATAAMGQATGEAPAATLCPWFTNGSAERVLGGSVALTAKVDGSFSGSCRFTHQTGDAMRAIDVLVGNADTHACPPNATKLKTLGNEAVQCTATGDGNYSIAGRIRDVFFVITLSHVPDAVREPSANARPSDPYHATVLEQVAEQVVGNLY
jgi:hypothetical protein